MFTGQTEEVLMIVPLQPSFAVFSLQSNTRHLSMSNNVTPKKKNPSFILGSLLKGSAQYL